jgi:hypothetical protein
MTLKLGKGLIFFTIFFRLFLWIIFIKKKHIIFLLWHMFVI